ncbi:MAG: YolD-like family protein [Clostridia bacterium]
MLSNVDRAKQFLPFDALKGFQSALREKEVEYVDKIELSEEKLEEISNKLQSLKIGEKVNITYYCGNKYNEIIGNIKSINKIAKYIELNDTNIYFIDILCIK